MTTAQLHALIKGRPCTRCGRASHPSTVGHVYRPVVRPGDRRAARLAQQARVARRRARRSVAA